MASSSGDSSENGVGSIDEDVDDTDELDEPTNNVIPSFSFSGCGFLGVYHIGVAACLRDHTDVVNRKEIRFAGASAGALVATSLLCDIDFSEVTRLMLMMARAVRNREAVDIGKTLKTLMHHCLPDDAHIRLRNRLHISVTILDIMENALVTDFQSKEHLIECLLASSFVPGFVGWTFPILDAEHMIANVVKGKAPFPMDGEVVEEIPEVLTRDEKIRRREISKRRRARKDTTLSLLPAHQVWVQRTSYIRLMLRLCIHSWRLTEWIVRLLPGGSFVLNKLSLPNLISDLRDFMSDLIMGVVTQDRYRVCDGGFSNNLPAFDKNTITVTPFSGESDICPTDLTNREGCVVITDNSMHANEDNVYRLMHALYPMEQKKLLQLCEDGYNECLRFLHKKELLSCKKHLMTRAVISSSPCNIGHANCDCPVCKSAKPKIQRSLSCADCHKTKHKALKSLLPKEVKHEFMKSMQIERRNRGSRTFWDDVLQLLWWCTKLLYATTLKLTVLALYFQKWVNTAWDLLASIAWYSYLSAQKKAILINSLLESMTLFINDML